MDALLFEKLLKQEQRALTCAWEAFISIQKEGKVPYPAIYSQTFTRIQSQKDLSEPELFQVLSEGQTFLKQLLTHLSRQYRKDKSLKIELKPEDLSKLIYLQKKLAKLEAEVSFLKEELLKDPLTQFWNRLGLQRIFDYVVRPHIYSEDYSLVVFYIILPKEENLRMYEDKIILASAKFIRNFFSPRDFLTRPGEKLLAVVTVGRKIPELQDLILRLAGRKFPCYLAGTRTYIAYKIGGTNILGVDHLNVVLERALSAAQQNRFVRV